MKYINKFAYIKQLIIIFDDGLIVVQIHISLNSSQVVE